MPTCCWMSTRGGERAHAALGARAVGDVDAVDAGVACSSRTPSSMPSGSTPRGGTISTVVRNSPRGELPRPSASARRGARARPAGAGLSASGAARTTRVRAGRERAHRVGDPPDVLRGGAAAAADEAHALADHARGVGGHVLGRGHVDLAARPPRAAARRWAGRRAGGRWRRRAGRRTPAWRAGPTLQFIPTTSTPHSSRRSAKRAASVPSGVWPSSWITICATIGRSQSERTARTACCISIRSPKVSRTKRSTPPSSSPSACSRKSSQRLVHRGGAVGLDAEPERPDGPGDAGPLARHRSGPARRRAR